MCSSFDRWLLGCPVYRYREGGRVLILTGKGGGLFLKEKVRRTGGVHKNEIRLGFLWLLVNHG